MKDNEAPPAEALMTVEQLQAEVRKLKRWAKTVRRETVQLCIDALGRESQGLHVRDADADKGLQRGIFVLYQLRLPE
jgi:hypothetical protein